MNSNDYAKNDGPQHACVTLVECYSYCFMVVMEDCLFTSLYIRSFRITGDKGKRY